jgi:hypothetical protein
MMRDTYYFVGRIYTLGKAAAQLIGALRYKPGGRGFDSQWGN